MSLVIKKCDSCNAYVKVINDCKCEGCGISCCGKALREVKANEVDAAREKHIPQVSKENDRVLVKVNHVMETEHYIEWICAVSDNHEEYFYFKPGDEAKCEFKYYPNMKVYAYCNLHGLWVNDID